MSSFIYFYFLRVNHELHIKYFLHVFIHSTNSLGQTVAAAGGEGIYVIADQQCEAGWITWS